MTRVDLSGEWTLQNRDRGIEIPAHLPGDNFSALFEAGIIPDPYLGDNELSCRWVGESEWTFSRTFTVSDDLLTGRNLYLHIESLDTCAEILMNGKSAGSSSNMFTRFRQTVTQLLHPGENTIEIVITPAETEARRRAANLTYPIPHTEFPVQSPGRNLIRKTQCHSGWDWGPCLMVSGMYGEIYLEAVPRFRIDYLHAAPRPAGEEWIVDGTLELYSYIEGEIPVSISIPDLPGQVESDKTFPISPGANRLDLSVTAPNPELWWPIGYGNQPLYTLRVVADGTVQELRIGFRTIDVLTGEDEHGRSMVFRVNGRNIFCKGANWIPVEALPSRESEMKLSRLLSDAAFANMNMLRVWGGGRYESDRFYDICDEKGILIWQDFMFSCACYPSDAGFLEEVEEEVRHQVKRLKTHPSLALWCGNNECLGALTWYEVSRKNRDRYLVDYDRLYHGVVEKNVRSLDPGRKFWSSSPSGGPADYSDCWHDDTRGDMHYWSVWHEGKPFESYYDVIPRFCSEFGFQSFPSMETLRSFAHTDQMNLTSPIMEHHQRHPRGNTIIIETLSRYFRFPEKLEHFIYLSQVQHAMAMKTAVEFWRSRRPICMGALYWQLNDLWPSISWSSIEYSGKWKLLHYAAKRFFDPVHITAFFHEGNLEIWGLNDLETQLEGELSISYIGFDGEIISTETRGCNIPAEASALWHTLPRDECPVGKNQGVLRVKFISRGYERENDLFPASPKRCFPEVPDIKVVTGLVNAEVTLTLETDKPAFFVTFDQGSIAGLFSDNCFSLYPGEKKTVTFTWRETDQAGKSAANREDTLKKLENDLRLYHLRDTY